MPRVRGVIVASACAVGAVLGVNGVSLADATLAASCDGGAGVQQADAATAGSLVAHSATFCAQAEERTSGHPASGTPFVATATRHQPISTRELPPGVEDPATDRAMALLVGWVLVVMVGGGLFAGRNPRRG